MASITTNNVCDDTAYLNSINQKSRFQLLNIPPVRYNNLSTNPYTQINPTTGKVFTKDDLDMRRKVEILKYSSNRMSTQTNNLTNAQRFAQLVRGRYQQRTYSQSFIQENTDENGLLQVCPPGTIIKTPSTASGIPGPPIYLYEDYNVPLYNFNTNIDSAYGIQNQEVNPYIKVWDFVRLSNIACPFINNSTTYSTFTNIYIMNTTDTPSYTYNITTPISLYIAGTLKDGVTAPYNDSHALRINISSVSVNVKYSYSNVSLNPAPTIQYEHGLSSGSIPIDISINIPDGQRIFYGNCYLGLLNINNINLLTEKGYIYDIESAINYQISYPTTSTYGTKCNIPTISSFINIPFSSVSPIQNINSTITGGSTIPSSANFPVLSITRIP